MAKPILALLASAALVSCSGGEGAKDGAASDDQVAAIAMPEEQFRSLLRRSVLTTQSAAMHMYALGLSEGCAVLNNAVDGAVERNLPKWRAELIAAYRANVPPEKLAEAVRSSPGEARDMLKDHLPNIATTMQRSSQSLLTTAGVAVLERTAAAASKIDPASVDNEARQKELRSMAAKGAICGSEAPRQG